MRLVRLGRNGPDVSEMGLGCMGMSGGYGPADDAESIATIHAALEAGITMLDTGDFYGSGHNEMLIREALKSGKRERAFIAVKFGAMRGPDLKFLGDDGRPNSVKNFLAYTLRRLGTDHVDLYQPARLDPTVPIEDTIGAIADMVKAGYVRHIGLSEASAKSIRRAHAVHPIAALQIEYSLVSRDIEREILTAGEDFCGLMQAARLSIGLALLWQTQAHKDPWNEDAVCDLCLSPEVAIKPKNRDDTEIIEPDIAVCTLTDVVGHYAFAVIVCWRLCELARTCNVAATNVEPVAAHPPIGYVGHRHTPCARSATCGPEFPF